MKTIYTIQIKGAIKENIWYANKIGNTYEAFLVLKPKRMFEVKHKHFVYPSDCEVISKREEESYHKSY